MKQIVLSVLVLIYAISTLTLFMEFNENEYERLTFGDYTEVLVTNWEREMPIEEKIRDVCEYAKNKGINIVKKGNDNEVYYCAIGDIDGFCDVLKLEESDVQELENGDSWIIANRKIDDDNQVAIVSSFYNGKKLVYKSLENEEESILGAYYVSNESVSFAEDMGFYVSNMNNVSISSFEMVRICVVIVFVIVLLFTYLLYSVQRQKEVALCRMLGWKKNDIAVDIFLKKEIGINVCAITFTYICAVIAAFVYNGGVGLLQLTKVIAISNLIICLVIILVSFIMFYACSGTKPVMVIKNKRPIKLINAVCYSAKFIMVIVICLLGLNVVNNMVKYKENSELIDSIENIGDKYVYSVEPAYGVDTSLDILCKIGAGFRNLYNELDRKSVAYWGMVDNNRILFVNEEYLREYEILLSDGLIYEHNGNENLVLLIPEKLAENEDRIKESFAAWIDNQAAIEEMFNEMDKNDKGIIPNAEAIDVKKIKNVQKDMLYHIENEGYDNNVIAVFNTKNVSRDFFVSLLITQSVFIDTEASNIDVKQYGLDGVILGVERISDRYYEYLNSLKQYNRMQIASVCILFVTMVVSVYFICENYLEQNKLLLSVENIHGYTFWDKHKFFIICNIILYYLVMLFMITFSSKIAGLFLLNNIKNVIMSIVLLLMFIMLVDIVIMLFLCMKLGNKKNIEVLKGV